MSWLEQGVKDFVAWVLPFGPWGLFVVSFAESSFFPIPPDILLIALATADPASSLWLAFLTVAGSVLGGMFGYWIGLKGGRPLLHRLFKQERVLVVERYYQRWDVWAVGAAGLTPLPYKVFTISAGAFNLNFPRFVLASVASRGLRFMAEGVLFWFFGAQIQSFVSDYFGWVTAGFFVLLVAGFYLVRMLGRRAVKSEAN